MRVDLSKLSTQTLELQLSPPQAALSDQQFVRLLETCALSGVLETDERGLRISNALAQKVVIDALRLKFGKVVLEGEGGIFVSHASTDYVNIDGGLEMNLLMGEFKCPKLTVLVSTIKACAELELEQGRVRVTSEGGRIEAPCCTFKNFALDITDIKLSASMLKVQNLVIEWGDDGFELHAEAVVIPRLEMLIAGSTVQLQQLECTHLDIHDSDWSIKGLLIDSGQVSVQEKGDPLQAVAEASEQVAAEVSEPAERNTSDKSATDEAAISAPRYEGELPIFAWNLLDTLSGHVNVDLGVEIKLPIIQHRRSVHHFRVPLESGKVNYRELEHNLSTLEDMFLDFSVRPGELVLELGVPFFPSRGHGKRLVRWPLSDQEEAWAEKHWVRLATLAQPQLVVGEEAPAPLSLPTGQAAQPENTLQTHDSNSSTPTASDSQAAVSENETLQQLTFRNLDVQLSLTQPSVEQNAMLKNLQIGSLVVQGDVVYRKDGELEQTQVQGTMSDIVVSVDDFPLAGRKFDLNQLVFEGENQFDAQLENLKLLCGTLNLGKVSAKSVDFGVYAEGPLTSVET